MHYKTMILELLQEQYPALHERLRTRRTLLAALERYAQALKNSHDAWTVRLAQAQPQNDPGLIASAALQIALTEFQERILCAPLPTDGEDLFLDAAMAFVRQATSSE